MAKFKPQFRRLLHIDEKLKEARQKWLREQDQQIDLLMADGHFPNCRSLAVELEVSDKTIQRDIDFMRDEQGAPIEYDHRRKGFYYTEDNFSLPVMKISESDLFAICVAEQALKQYEGTPLYDKLASIYGKIEDSLPDTVSLPAQWVNNRISFREPPPRHLDPKVWDLVTRALSKSRTLLVDYRTPNKPKKPRRINPYHMMNHRGEWYVLAYCHNNDEVRVFAVSRIQHAELLRSKFQVPDAFDPQEMFAHSFGIMWTDKTHEVQIRFSAAAAPYAMERDWQKGQTVRENKDGSVVLAFEVSDLRELKSWLLSWGPQAKVLAPGKLVSEIAEELRTAAALYT